MKLRPTANGFRIKTGSIVKEIGQAVSESSDDIHEVVAWIKMKHC